MSERKEKREALFPEITRRGLLKAGSALVTLPFVMSGKAMAAKTAAGTAQASAESAERVVQTCSTFDCGGKCDIRAHVADGVVTQITTRPDSALDPQMPVMRACVRGRSYRKFVYHPDRLKYPMKRVGKRGRGSLNASPGKKPPRLSPTTCNASPPNMARRAALCTTIPPPAGAPSLAIK